MPRHDEAVVLCDAGVDTFGRHVQLTPSTREAWLAMHGAAEAEGVTLLLVSGYRSVERQAEIVAAKLRAGLTLEEILRVNAYPGFSEHHTGRAIDLAAPGFERLTESFETTAAFRWLTANGRRFGFAMTYPMGNACGICYEPWHWCWHGEGPACGRMDA